MSIKKTLVNIFPGVALDDDLAESIVNVIDVGKRTMEDFRQQQLISKEIISCTDKEKQL